MRVRAREPGSAAGKAAGSSGQARGVPVVVPGGGVRPVVGGRTVFTVTVAVTVFMADASTVAQARADSGARRRSRGEFMDSPSRLVNRLLFEVVRSCRRILGLSGSSRAQSSCGANSAGRQAGTGASTVVVVAFVLRVRVSARGGVSVVTWGEGVLDLLASGGLVVGRAVGVGLRSPTIEALISFM